MKNYEFVDYNNGLLTQYLIKDNNGGNQYHRTDGPARIWNPGLAIEEAHYFLFGKELSFEEWQRRMNMEVIKDFLELKE